MLSGTAVRSAIGCPTAAKTGTTSDLKDAWLDGYNPDYSTVVWIGYPNSELSMTDVHGEPQQGGAIPAQIWHDYMSQVVGGGNCTPLPTPTSQIQYSPFFGKYGTSNSSQGSTGLTGSFNSPAVTSSSSSSSSSSQSGNGNSSHGGAGTHRRR